MPDRTLSFPSRPWTGLGLLALLAPGCFANYDLSGKASDDTGGGGYYDGDYAYDTGGAGGAADSGDSAPPESEDDFLRLAPAATDAYVFVANPTNNSVTRIQVPGLQVDTRDVGVDPTVVATSSDYTHAVTFNAGSDDVSIIDAASFSVTNVAVRDNFNAMSMSADGKWVMCWFNQAEDAVDTSGGVQSFNEVSFVNLETAVHTGMAVGFNPRGIRWTPDGRLALVISDAALAIVDLTQPTLSPTLIEISDDPVNAPPAEEVELTADGKYAFVRQFGADAILVVSLDDLTVDSVPVGANPTDLDLSPDGGTVAVVSRGAHELWTFAAANPYEPATVLPFDADSSFGSVVYAGAGDQAVLYTNATLLPKYAVWDTRTGDIVEKSLVKPIQTLGLSPTGDSLLVFHTKADADGADTSSPFYNEWALTLIDMGDFRQNPMLLPAEPTAYTTSEDGRYGFFIMDGLDFLETLHFDSLLYDEVLLKSQPVYIGVLPGTDLAYASQEYDLGRISFYDPDAQTLDTVTGFELNADIDHQDQ